MPEENQTTNNQENKNQPAQPTDQKNNGPAPRNIIKRRTAYRLFIGMISQGRPEFRDTRFLFSWINHKETTRVNIIGNITDKFQSEQKPYAAITIDDGTGTIRIKTFSDTLSMIKNFNPGDTINVIGKLAHFNNEIYILPEIIKESSITWLIARKLELEKDFGKEIVKRLSDQQSAQQSQQQIQQEQQANQIQETTTEEKIGEETTKEQTTRDEIISKIKQSEPEGLDIDKIILQMNKPVDEINNTITKLLESGDIYEPKPGRLRIL
jgi:RPA family protein